MKALADCGTPPRHGPHECLRHVVRMDVMDRLHSEIWQNHLASRRQKGKHLRIEIAGGIQWTPAGTHKMTGMQRRRREPGIACYLQKVRLNRSLAAAIIAEGLSRRIFPRRHLHTITVYPDGSAVEKVLYPSAQSVHQLAGAFHRVTGQIDHHLAAKLRDPFPKPSRRFLGRAIKLDWNDLLPRLVRAIRLPAAPRDADHLVPALDQPRRKIGSDMSATPDDDDSHR